MERHRHRRLGRPQGDRQGDPCLPNLCAAGSARRGWLHHGPFGHGASLRRGRPVLSADQLPGRPHRKRSARSAACSRA